jgi:hypothetical protein
VIAQNMQDLIDNCLTYHAEYLNITEVGSSYVNRDFLGARLEPQEIQALLQLYTAGTITQETLLQNLADGEVLGDDFDVQEELEATQTGGMIEMAQPEPRVNEQMPEQSAEPEDTSDIPAS